MERALIVGLAHSPRERWQKIDSLAELAALTRTARGEVVGQLLQIRPHPEPASLLGRGKILEIREMAQQHGIELLIFDEPLTPSQVRNIERLTGVRVIDRTALILDIFALHAKTAEAKHQVELAQLEYRYTMLTGRGVELSRLGGGIGTRGPGEKKLEEDRRRIRARISVLKRELKEIEKLRRVQRKPRADLFSISLAGYTNSGKSTLMNRLTGAGVKVAPELFATLDPNTKALVLNRRVKALLTDTVGFIRDLPHELVASFRTTLGELREADLILHVADAEREDLAEQIAVVNKVLDELGCQDKPKFLVLNKCDRLLPEEIARLERRYPEASLISALYGDGVEELKLKLATILEQASVVREFEIPAQRWDLVHWAYEFGEVLSRDDAGDRLQITVKGPLERLARLKKLIERAQAAVV